MYLVKEEHPIQKCSAPKGSSAGVERRRPSGLIPRRPNIEACERRAHVPPRSDDAGAPPHRPKLSMTWAHQFELYLDERRLFSILGCLDCSWSA